MFWILACAVPDDSPAAADSPAAVDTGPAPEIPVFTSTASTAVWTGEDALASLLATLANEFPSAAVMRAELDTWFSHGDEGCPGAGTWMIGPSLEGCVAESGYYYLGVGGYQYSEQSDEFGATRNVAMMLDATLTSTEHDSLLAGGHWLHNWGEVEDAVSFDLFINGSWKQQGAEAPWLDKGVSGWLEAGGARSPTGDQFGFLRGVLAMYGNHLRFDEVLFGEDGCEGVPTGAFKIRDPGGGWWTLDFGEDCTPCGALSFEDEAVETDQCPELGGLLERIMVTELP